MPAGIPNYEVGQKIKFKIGARGQLTGPDSLSLPFKNDGGTANVYYIQPSRSNPSDIGKVFKNANGKPTASALTFFKVKISGFTPHHKHRGLLAGIKPGDINFTCKGGPCALLCRLPLAG